MVNVDLFVPFLQRQTRCPVRVVVVAASAARICLPPHSLAAPYAVVSSPHQARVVPTDRSPYGACAMAPLAPTACFASRTYARGLAVQHLVSQIAVVSCRLASLHSLTALVRTVQFPPADHSGRSRVALMPYLIFVCCPGIQQRDRRRRRIGRLFPSVRSSARAVLWFAARPSTFFCRCGQRGRRRHIGRLFLRVRSAAPTVLWFAARSPPVFCR